ncbi:hypothetical protein SLEP1_g39103 [Rubroshorea leprosula]|uniref:PUM-HD domain-containing protein n=1 Tax=Rubroshorea leprosula TaxID=152421 RepID=A0AAV5KZE2_9ROSI|nr:hypothetical protein SLEP1_g39103 [Rubroshorea leprosula]
MEEGRMESEYDELERLLGEIPQATAGNSHSEESVLKSMSLNVGMLPISVDSCKGPSNENLHKNGGLDEFKLSVNETQKSPNKRAPLVEADLADDHSLTTAFAELSFSDEVKVATESPLLANGKSSSNHAIILDCQYAHNIKRQISNVDSRVMVVPSFQASNNASHGSEEFDITKVGLKSQEAKKLQIGYCQPGENLSAGLPLAHGVQGLQFLSNTPAPAAGFSLMSDQQPYHADARSPLPYLHSQQVSQPHSSWRSIDEEQYYRIHQQYLYLQQLRNQRLEAQHPIQANGNFPTTQVNWTVRQPSIEIPISYPLERSNQELYSLNYATPGAFSQSNPTFSSTDMRESDFLDKVGKQSFPEKILTRSQGLNSLKAVKFSSFLGSESLAHVNQNGKVLSNGHFCPGFYSPTARCFQPDNLNIWGLSTDNTDLKNINLRPQPPKYSSVDEVTGRIYLMAKDQHGCRFLQRKFSEGTAEDVRKIFLEIIDHIVELMTDPFGNYLVQKLLEVCDEEQRMQILRTITRKQGDLVRISCDMHGTRAVQKVIETLKTPEQYSMVVSSLKPGIVTLIKNMNGNHVAQRCLQYLMPNYSEFLFEAATAKCVELATDRHGCCVLQKCLSYSDEDQRNRLVFQITSNALILSQDPFGNYVVQYVFELELTWATQDILDQLEGNYGDLSMQKYSSNVVEKCLKYAGEEWRTRIIRELINNSHLDQIMQDPYGNYVIQAALQQSKGALHAALVDAIRTHVPVLRTSPYGKKVLSSNGLKK